MLAIIGGTGLTQLSNLEVTRREVVRTPWGEPSGALTFGRIGSREVVFLARHGDGHTIPPHMVNYRANIWALQRAEGHARGLGRLGRRHPGRSGPGVIAVPHQIIDYTSGRSGHLLRGRRARRRAHRLHPPVLRVAAPALPRRRPARRPAGGRRRRVRHHPGPAPGDRRRDRPPRARRRRHGGHDRRCRRRPWRASSTCAMPPSRWWPTTPPGAAASSAGIRMEDINATLQGALAKVRRIIEALVEQHGG